MTTHTRAIATTSSVVPGAVVLEVRELSVEFGGPQGWLRVVEDVSFTLEAGRTLGLIGETVCGKSSTGLAIAGLIPFKGGRIPKGEVLLDGRDLLTLDERGWRHVRGRRIAMIFQQPNRCLNPAYTVGDQIAETVRAHLGLSRGDSWRRALELLERVRIPNAAGRAHEYPHTFSGGMCQRVMIAMALACEPQVLIADEPTTALDVTVQARILELLRELQSGMGLAILFITHDLGVMAQISDAAVVMYAGQIVENRSIDDLLGAPRHPYTAGLLASVPRVGQRRKLAAIAGAVPGSSVRPDGCRFHPRCSHAVAGRCDVEMPPLEYRARNDADRCLRSSELSLSGAVS